VVSTALVNDYTKTTDIERPQLPIERLSLSLSVPNVTQQVGLPLILFSLMACTHRATHVLHSV